MCTPIPVHCSGEPSCQLDVSAGLAAACLTINLSLRVPLHELLESLSQLGIPARGSSFRQRTPPPASYAQTVCSPTRDAGVSFGGGLEPQAYGTLHGSRGSGRGGLPRSPAPSAQRRAWEDRASGGGARDQLGTYGTPDRAQYRSSQASAAEHSTQKLEVLASRGLAIGGPHSRVAGGPSFGTPAPHALAAGPLGDKRDGVTGFAAPQSPLSPSMRRGRINTVVLKGHKDQLTSGAWSPTDPACVLSGGADGRTYLWKQGEDGTWESRGYTAAHNKGWVTAVAWSPDGGYMATGSDDATCKIWKAPDDEGDAFEEVAKLSADSEEDGANTIVRCIAWSADGTHLALGRGNNKIVLYQKDADAGPESWEVEKVLMGTRAFGMVLCCAFAPNSELLLAGSSDTTATVYESENKWLGMQLSGYSGWVRSCSWNSEGSMLIIGCGDATARVFKWPKPDEMKAHVPSATLSCVGAAVTAVAWHPHARIVLTASEDKIVRIWRDNGNEPDMNWEVLLGLEGHKECIVAAGWNKDGDDLMTASQDRTVRIWKHSDAGRVW